MAIYFESTKRFRESVTPRPHYFVMPCSVEREEQSFDDLRRIADRALPFNHRIGDDEVIRISNRILSEFDDPYKTSWKDLYLRFEEQLRKNYEDERALYETSFPGMTFCELSAPAPGLTIQCDLPQSGIVGWGFTYFLQDNSAASD